MLLMKRSLYNILDMEGVVNVSPILDDFIIEERIQDLAMYMHMYIQCIFYSKED